MLCAHVQRTFGACVASRKSVVMGGDRLSVGSRYGIHSQQIFIKISMVLIGPILYYISAQAHALQKIQFFFCVTMESRSTNDPTWHAFIYSQSHTRKKNRADIKRRRIHYESFLPPTTTKKKKRKETCLDWCNTIYTPVSCDFVQYNIILQCKYLTCP